MSYLQHLPAHIVKIDRSFIMSLGTDGPDVRIVRAIVDLSRALGISVTAEGVETEEQLATLRAMGVDRVQGYLLGRPQDAETMTTLLAGSGASCSWGSPEPDCDDADTEDAEALTVARGASDTDLQP